MSAGSLRYIIRNAFLHEKTTQEMARQLNAQLSQVPDGLAINGSEALVNFAMEYIHQVPTVLESLKDAAQRGGIRKHVTPFLNTAENYFLNPPPLPDEHTGLMALMDEAYLAHRLFEEVNDRYIAKVGRPLIPWDMTLANVVAYQLIGEELANQLDQTVQQTVEQMMDKESSYDSPRFQAYVQERHGGATPILQEWPCLSQAMGIDWGFAM